MDCNEATQLWHDRCDGELTPIRAAAMEDHLRTCESCRAYHRQMDALSSAFADLRDDSQAAAGVPDETPASHVTRVARSGWRWGSAWRIGGMAAAAALALVVGTGLYLSQRDPTRIGNAGLPTSMPHAITPVGESQPVPAKVILTGSSAVRFIPVEQKTHQPNVHVFVLYRTGEETTQPIKENDS